MVRLEAAKHSNTFRHDIRSGFSKKRPPIFVHVDKNAIVFAISKQLTMFVGTGNSRITKWHTKTAGAGRWQYPQQMDGLDFPVKSLSISEDSTLLVAVLDDNSLLVGRTSTMTIVSKPPVMLWPKDMKHHWLCLHLDPARPDCVITTGRLGMVQWIDPVRWVTVGMVWIC